MHILPFGCKSDCLGCSAQTIACHGCQLTGARHCLLPRNQEHLSDRLLSHGQQDQTAAVLHQKKADGFLPTPSVRMAKGTAGCISCSSVSIAWLGPVLKKVHFNAFFWHKTCQTWRFRLNDQHKANIRQRSPLFH